MSPFTRWRWSLGTPGFVGIVALANALLFHYPLYAFSAAHLDTASASGLLTLATVGVLVVFVTALIFGLVALASERALKPLAMLAAVCSSVALYFVQAYGVVLDKTMMGNVLNSNAAEAGELFHPKLLAYVLALGVLPAWLLSRVTVRPTSIWRRLGFVGVVLVAGVGWGYANARSWLWLDEHAKVLGGMTMPWSYAINGSRNLADRIKPREQKPLPAATFASNRKTVVLLLIGEAARAQNFSLYGYARPTNPVMTADGVVALPHAHSCSTYTTASLLCMLSHRESGDAAGWEPLTSYLARNGVDVIWRTANWGEPPMKVQEFVHAGELRRSCQGEDCGYDEVLLQGLAERIRASTRDRVFVALQLHGSHGPEYYTKYPPRFETFAPVCKSVELQRCTSAELVNAYDNTIVYADHVTGRAIELLRGLPVADSLLMFVSDHGESLGEYGLYLHGTPYAIAPDVQKDIPFILWLSDAFKRRKVIGPAHFAPDATHSQANVFHSVMGAFDMRSDVYRPDLDVFSNAPDPN